MAWSTSLTQGPCSSMTMRALPLSSSLRAIAPPATPAPTMTTSTWSAVDTSHLPGLLVTTARSARKRWVAIEVVAEGLGGTVVVRARLPQRIGHAARPVVAVVDPAPEPRELRRVGALEPPDPRRDRLGRGVLDAAQEQFEVLGLHRVDPFCNESRYERSGVRKARRLRDHDLGHSGQFADRFL